MKNNPTNETTVTSAIKKPYFVKVTFLPESNACFRREFLAVKVSSGYSDLSFNCSRAGGGIVTAHGWCLELCWRCGTSNS